MANPYKKDCIALGSTMKLKKTSEGGLGPTLTPCVLRKHRNQIQALLPLMGSLAGTRDVFEMIIQSLVIQYNASILFFLREVQQRKVSFRRSIHLRVNLEKKFKTLFDTD